MKKLSFFHSLLAALVLSAAFTACSKDDDENKTPEPEPSPAAATYHYDLTVVAGNHGGMTKDKSHITLSVPSLADAATTISFEGQGAEITDFYQSMTEGDIYPVIHDCSTVLRFEHYFSMSGKNGTQEKSLTGMFLYIPDNRNSYGERNYDVNHQPEVGIYVI